MTVQPLEGGLTNHNYKVEAVGEVYVLRIAGANTELLGIDRAREAACARAAAAVGVGTEVIMYLPEQGALLTRFVPGRTLADDDARQPGIIARIAETLRRLHAAPSDESTGSFSVFETVHKYVARTRARRVPVSDDLQVALRLLKRIEEQVHTPEPACLCHNDLIASNLIDDGASIRLIDWEYAGRGDRFFDLGNLAVNLQFSAEQDETLLHAYFGALGSEHRRQLRLMRLASDLREATWGFLQAGISQLHPQEYYLDYGRKHLDRFLRAAEGLI